MKSYKIAIAALAAATLASCIRPLDTTTLMSGVDIDQINQNQSIENNSAGNAFTVTGVAKGTSNPLSSATSVDVSGSVPIIITFDSGVVSACDVTIYYIGSGGDRGAAVNVTQTLFLDTGSGSSSMYIYTDNLAATTTYEVIIKASGTHNSGGGYLDNDGDGITGEAQDDIVFRFSTGGSVVSLLQPMPTDIVSVPGAGGLITGATILKTDPSQYIKTNGIGDSTNGSDIDPDSVTGSITLLSITENKTYPVTVVFKTGLISTNLIVTLPSSLPLGAYMIYFDQRAITEASPVYGYTHFGSLNNNHTYSPANTAFRVVSGNTIPALNGYTANGKSVTITFNVPMDTATLTTANIFAYDSITDSSLPTTIVIVDSQTIEVSVSSTISGSFGVSDRLHLYLLAYKIKSENGDVMATSLNNQD